MPCVIMRDDMFLVRIFTFFDCLIFLIPNVLIKNHEFIPKTDKKVKITAKNIICQMIKQDSWIYFSASLIKMCDFFIKIHKI